MPKQKVALDRIRSVADGKVPENCRSPRSQTCSVLVNKKVLCVGTNTAARVKEFEALPGGFVLCLSVEPKGALSDVMWAANCIVEDAFGRLAFRTLRGLPRARR